MDEADIRRRLECGPVDRYTIEKTLALLDAIGKERDEFRGRAEKAESDLAYWREVEEATNKNWHEARRKLAEYEQRWNDAARIELAARCLDTGRGVAASPEYEICQKFFAAVRAHAGALQ